MLTKFRLLTIAGAVLMLLAGGTSWAQDEEVNIDDVLGDDAGAAKKADTAGAAGEEAAGEASDDGTTAAAAEGEETAEADEKPAAEKATGDIYPTIGGFSGLYRTVTTDIGSQHSFRMALHTQIFKASDFLVTNDENSRFIGNLVVNYTPWKYIEIFLGLQSSANSNTRPAEVNRLDQELILALGDFSLGLKGQYLFTPYLGAGADMALTFLNSVGGVAFSGESTSFQVGLYSTLDLDPLASFPLRFHFNFGYFLDNSDNLAEFTNKNYSLASLQVEKFALGINRPRLQFKLAADLPLRKYLGFGLTPSLEFAADLATGDSDEDFDNQVFRTTAGLKDEDIDGRSTIWMTLGARANPIAGLLLGIGVDIGVASPGYGFGPPVVPWNLLLNLGYAYEAAPVVKIVEKEKIVEKKVEVAAVLGKIRGRVVNASTLEPVSGAVVTFPGKDLTGLYTDPDGTFVTYEMPAGSVTLQVRHKDYDPSRTTVEIVAGQTGNVDIKLTSAVPPVGTVRGKVTDLKGKTVAATITLDGPEKQDVSPMASGEYKVELKPGSYTIDVEAKGYFHKAGQVNLVAGGTANIDFVLSKKPARSLVQVTSHAILIKQEVHFGTGTAEIKDDSRQLLDSVADALLSNKGISKLEIQGHTDNRGKLEANMKLSDARANAVRDYLISGGVQASRLMAKGYGPTRPKRPNITRSNRAKNRRVEFVILEQQ